MGYPGKNKKKYETPKHPWQAVRLIEEVGYVKTYGLRNKREVWNAQSMLRKYRRMAMKLLAETTEGESTGHVSQNTDNILNRLKRYGILSTDGGLDDILALKTKDFLERRLQTQVYRLGFASTVKQSRQFITHGHISIEEKMVTIPSYLVSKEGELKIEYYANSPLQNKNHPQRLEEIVKNEIIQIKEVEKDRKRRSKRK